MWHTLWLWNSRQYTNDSAREELQSGFVSDFCMPITTIHAWNETILDVQHIRIYPKLVSDMLQEDIVQNYPLHMQ